MLKFFTFKNLLVFVLSASFLMALNGVEAQTTILSQDFEGVTAPALPASWTSTNPNGGDLFVTGDSAAANAGTYWPVDAHGQFAFANDDVCNCDMSEVRLILPPLDLTSYTGTTVSAEVWSDQVYTMEENSLEVSVDNGATWTTVGANFPVMTAWQSITMDLSAYDGMSNVWVAFRHNDVGGWGQGLAVDDVLVEGVPVGPTCLFNEDFEGVTPPALPASWTSTNPNGGDLFVTGDSVAANAGTYWPVDGHGQFAFANDDVCNCDMSEVRLILPPQDFTGLSGITLDAEVWSDQVYTMEENSLEVSLDNGATWTTVGINFPVMTAWQAISYDLSAYAGMSNVWIAFRHNDVGGWGQGLAVDDICISSSSGATSNAVIVSAPRLNAEYSVVAFAHETPALISADVQNAGGTDLTNVILTSNLYEESDPVNPIAVINSDPLTIASGEVVTIDNNTAAINIGALGRYYVEHIVTHDNSANETDTSNDTLVTGITEISETLYARNDTSSADLGGFGIGTGGGNNAIIGQNFEMLTAATVEAVEIVLDGEDTGVPGEPVSVAVYACDANGIPQAPALDTTEVQMTADGTIDETFVLSFDPPLDLATGIYFFGAMEEGPGNIGVRANADIYTPGDNTQGTNWVKWDGNPNGPDAFTEPTTIVTAFAVAYHIRPILSPPACVPGDLLGGGGPGLVCGSGTFNFTTDGTESIPPGGSFGWNFTPGPDGGGGVPSGFSITGSSPQVEWDANLNGILSDNGLDPLTGTWNVQGFVYEDPNDVGGSLCGFTTGTYEIFFGPEVSAAATATDENCATANGTATANAAGGTGTLTIEWSNGATTDMITDLSAGTYTVTITDEVGCTALDTVTVEGAEALLQSATITNESVSGANDGAIDLVVTGGTEPYTYNWSNGAMTASISGLAGGDYTVTVTDGDGCESISTYTIETVVGIAHIEGLRSLKVYPNPSDQEVFLAIDLANDMRVQLDVFTVTGERILSLPAENVLEKQYQLDVKDYPAGMYLARFTIEGQTVTKRFTIAR